MTHVLVHFVWHCLLFLVVSCVHDVLPRFCVGRPIGYTFLPTTPCHVGCVSCALCWRVLSMTGAICSANFSTACASSSLHCLFTPFGRSAAHGVWPTVSPRSRLSS